MKITLTDKYRTAPNYGKIMEADIHKDYVIIKVAGDSFELPIEEFKRQKRKGIFEEVNS